MDKIPQQSAAGRTTDRESSATAGPSGFTDLINLLLSPPDLPASEDPTVDVTAAGTEDASPPEVRSPREIADALIKLMSGRATPATNAFSDAPVGKPNDSKADRKQREGAPIVVPAPISTPQTLFPPTQPADSPSHERALAQPGTTIDASMKIAISSAPLAFALKLIHNDPGTTDSAAAPPPDKAADDESQNSATKGAHESKAPTPELAHEPTGPKASDSRQSSLEPAASDPVPPPVIATIASPSPTAILPRATGAGESPQPAPNPANALRSSVEVAPAPPVRNAPAQEIAVRIARPEAPSVDVHLTERAGQVHVAVRTPDAGLQTSLRQDLGTLVNSLERAGFHTEAAVPHGGIEAQPSGQMSFQNSSHDRQDANGGWNGSGGGQSGRDSGGHRQQEQDRREPQDWIETMEDFQ